MAAISVISTTITTDHVTIIIGDLPEPETASFWVKYSVPVKSAAGMSVVKIRQEALRALQNAVDVQIAGP